MTDNTELIAEARDYADFRGGTIREYESAQMLGKLADTMAVADRDYRDYSDLLKRLAGIDTTNQAPDDPVQPEPPAPPVEVEMRVRSKSAGTIGYCVWQVRQAGIWLINANEMRPGPQPERFATNLTARASANAWLAALSEQVGVKLKAAWKDGE